MRKTDSRIIALLFAIMMLAITACTTQPDLAADRAALIQADRDFASETAARGADGWVDYFTEDAVMFPDAGIVEGREAIRELMKPVFTPENPRLTWEPTSAVVGSGGDLGYTLGRWARVATLPDGSDSTLSTGNYLTIWKKVPGTGWRVAVDIGNDDPE